MSNLCSGSTEQIDLTRQAELFQALSTEVRIAVLLVLADADLPVNELVEALRQRWPDREWERTNISKHLMVLRAAGVVSFRGEAQKRIYHLEMPCLVRAVGCAAEVADRGGCGI